MVTARFPVGPAVPPSGHHARAQAWAGKAFQVSSLADSDELSKTAATDDSKPGLWAAAASE